MFSIPLCMCYECAVGNSLFYMRFCCKYTCNHVRYELIPFICTLPILNKRNTVLCRGKLWHRVDDGILCKDTVATWHIGLYTAKH